MDATQFWVHQQTRRFVASCRCALQRIQAARHYSDVAHAIRISIPVEIRGTAKCTPEYLAMKRAAEQKIQALLDAQFAKLAQLGTSERLAAIGRARLELMCLRGCFPNELSQATIALDRLAHRPQ